MSCIHSPHAQTISNKLPHSEWLQDPVSRKILAATLAKTPKYLSECNPEDGYVNELASLLHHQREHRVLDLVGTKTVRGLFTEAWSILHTQPHYDEFDLETEKLRGELLAVCDAAGSALVEKSSVDTTQKLPPTKEEVLNLIVKTPLPVFDQNIHEK